MLFDGESRADKAGDIKLTDIEEQTQVVLRPPVEQTVVRKKTGTLHAMFARGGL